MTLDDFIQKFEICAVLPSDSADEKKIKDILHKVRWVDVVLGKNPPVSKAVETAQKLSFSKSIWIDIFLTHRELEKFFVEFSPKEKCVFNSIHPDETEIFLGLGKEKFWAVIFQTEKDEFEKISELLNHNIFVFYDPVFFPQLEARKFSDFLERCRLAKRKFPDVRTVCAVWNEVFFFRKKFSPKKEGVVWFVTWLFYTLSISHSVDVVMLPENFLLHELMQHSRANIR